MPTSKSVAVMCETRSGKKIAGKKTVRWTSADVSKHITTSRKRNLFKQGRRVRVRQGGVLYLYKLAPAAA